MDDTAPCEECGGDSSRQLSVFAAYSRGDDGEVASMPSTGGGCGGCGFSPLCGSARGPGPASVAMGEETATSG